MTPRTGERIFDPAYAITLLEIAAEDLESARVLAQSKQGRRENIVFMAQQSIEKALKAVLCRKGVPVPLVHDLGALVAKLPSPLDPPFGYGLTRFNDYAGLLRYERGHSVLSSEDLQAAIDAADAVLKWAQSQ